MISRLIHGPVLWNGQPVRRDPTFDSSNHRPLIVELAASMTSNVLERLPKQFVIAKSLPAHLKNWQVRDFAGWSIAHAAELPLISILSQAGEQVGVVIGWAIQKGELLRHGGSIEVSQEHGGENVNEILAGLCGRFLCLYKQNGSVWATPDAGGLLPAVFSPNCEALASTPTIMSFYGQLSVDEELAEVFNIPERFGWYPFGLTPFNGVSRLLPNHAICLDDWRVKRLWPTHQSLPASGKVPAEITASIADLIRSNVGAIVKGSQGFVHLTAGFDSRMVLAASRPYVGSCTFETIRTSSFGTRLDCLIAAALAKNFELNHEFLDFVAPDKSEIDSWLWRTGYCIHDAVTNLGATVKQNDRHYHSITGTCGEVGRAYYWSANDINGKKVQVQDLLARLNQPVISKTVEAAKHWLGDLPVQRPSLIWDLAYVEQRLGCWGGPSVYGHDVSYPSLSPFNSLNIYKKILTLPEEYRCSQNFVQEFITHLWPALLQVPFNRAFGIKRLLFLRSEISKLLPVGVKRLIKRYKR